ncbi:MAG: type IV pili methyl-accepting chemotaxis transducer N-terminal domain-containing protein [Rhodospirillales bacterium]
MPPACSSPSPSASWPRDSRDQTVGTLYVSSASRLVMLSQRLAKAAERAVTGNKEALAQVKESRDQFASLVDTMSKGGEMGNQDVPATPDEIQPTLEALIKQWEKTDKDAQVVIAAEANLEGFGKAIAIISASNSK